MDFLAAIAGSGLGSLLGNATSGSQPDIGQQITNLVNGMNNTVGNASTQARQNTTTLTDAGISQVASGASQAQNYLSNANMTANQQAAMNSIAGLQSLQSAVSPYIAQGNNAYDAYMQSLGLSTPTVGTNALYQAQQAQSNNALQTQMLNDAFGGQAVANPGSAPVAPNQSSYMSGIPQALSLQQYQQQALQQAGLSNYLPYFNSNAESINNSTLQSLANQVFPGLSPNTSGNNYINAINTALQNGLNTYNGNTATYAADRQTQNAAYQQALQQYNTQAAAYQQQLGQYNQYSQLASLLTPGATSQQQQLLSAYGLS